MECCKCKWCGTAVPGTEYDQSLPAAGELLKRQSPAVSIAKRTPPIPEHVCVECITADEYFYALPKENGVMQVVLRPTPANMEIYKEKVPHYIIKKHSIVSADGNRGVRLPPEDVVRFGKIRFGNLVELINPGIHTIVGGNPILTLTQLKQLAHVMQTVKF